MEVLVIALAAVAAGALGALGPQAIAALPEPDDAEKTPYVEVAAIRGARPVMALLAAVAAGVVGWRLHTPELVPVWVAVAGIGSWMGFIDWHTRYLPLRLNILLYPLTWLLVALAALLLRDTDVLVRALVANVVVYLIYRLLYWAARRWFGGAFGYGDVRLSGVLAVALGAVSTEAVYIGTYGGFVLGALLGGGLALLKIVDAKGFAFGPFMLLGAVVGAAWAA